MFEQGQPKSLHSNFYGKNFTHNMPHYQTAHKSIASYDKSNLNIRNIEILRMTGEVTERFNEITLF